MPGEFGLGVDLEGGGVIPGADLLLLSTERFFKVLFLGD